jgi:class 3 adenylate cyclase
LGEVVHKRVVTCVSPRAEIWNRVADTERLNRFIGSEPLDWRKVDRADTAVRFVLRSRVGPIVSDYEEEPYEWVERNRFGFWRVIQRGLLAEMRASYVLKDADHGGCEVEAGIALKPRFAWAWPIVWVVSRAIFNKVIAYVHACDAAAAEGANVAVTSSPVDKAAVEKSLAALKGRYSAALLEQFGKHLSTASDVEVRRIRPFELADQWKGDRVETLRLCLDGVKAGLTELHWSLICPSCRGPTDSLPALDALESTGHCHFCDLSFDVDLDRAVEATFSPHPKVRAMDLRPYCIGSPRLKPHVVSQAVLGTGRDGELRAAEEPGRYRLFAQGGATAVVDVEPSAPEQVTAKLDGERLVPAQLTVRPGGAISVAAGAPRHVKLERTAWEFNAATAVIVSSLPEFRSQFGSAALRPGMVLKVGRVAILFSDLVGSTALYSRVGDAAAFGIVSDCLDFGRQLVERHGGTVVKTMGDAIMAVFADPAQAIATAAQTARGFPALVSRHADAAQLHVKIGIAAGPCTIVTANSVLDYFGQTVNTAARVQHLAGGGEIVLTADLLEAARPDSRLQVTERFEARVKGIDQPLSLVRLRPGE